MLTDAFTKVAQHACRQGEANTRSWPALKSLPAPESWHMVGEQYAQEFARELLDAYFDHERLIRDLAATVDPPSPIPVPTGIGAPEKP